jgi:uncharacterized protein (UPF0276 family)
LIEAITDLVDFYEIEPATVSLSPGVEAVTHPDGPLARLNSRGKTVVVHGVSCPVGGTVPADSAEVAALSTASDLVGAPWLSEHLSINRFRSEAGAVVPTGFFLPPVQSPEAVEVAAEHLRRLERAACRPVAFETGVNYLQPISGELRDGEFFSAVAEAADCYILCDLHNLWCNQRNGRQPLTDVLDELPLERICEVHLAGGQRHDGFLLDAHSGLVEPALAALAFDVVARLPALRAVTFEIIPDYLGPNRIDADAYRGQLEQLHRLWEARGRRASGPAKARRSRRHGLCQGWSPASWESALRAALLGDPSPLAGDPGMQIYAHLIATIRAGAVVTSMPLSYRLLALSLGLAAADEVLDQYRSATPPAAWGRDEARAFGAYLKKHVTEVPHLGEVTDFELAAHEALETGTPRHVRFTCNPHSLLDPLRRGQLPSHLPTGVFEVVVDPQV